MVWVPSPIRIDLCALVDENSVVFRSSEKTVDKNSVEVNFSGVD